MERVSDVLSIDVRLSLVALFFIVANASSTVPTGIETRINTGMRFIFIV